MKDLAAHVDRDFARQIAAGDRGGDFSNISDLTCQVAGHEVYVVRKVFPGTANAEYLRLAAKFAFRTDFAGDARHFAGKCIELVHHRVDGVLQFENFSLHIDRDLA